MTKSDNYIIYPASNVTIYLHITSAIGNGPYAWCARIIDGKEAVEIGGASHTDHDTRLTIVGMIEALNAVKEPSCITFICSNHQYAVEHCLDRCSLSEEKEHKIKMLSNIDLFPALRKAKRRHICINSINVPRNDRDDEHSLAVSGAKRFLSELKDAIAFTPSLSEIISNKFHDV